MGERYFKRLVSRFNTTEETISVILKTGQQNWSKPKQRKIVGVRRIKHLRAMGTVKWSSICVIGTLEREETEIKEEELIAKSFLKLMKYIKSWIQEVQRIPKSTKQTNTPRHIIFKLLKILKAVRDQGKHVTE